MPGIYSSRYSDHRPDTRQILCVRAGQAAPGAGLLPMFPRRQSLFRLILTVSRFNSYAIIVMTNCGDRAVEQLRTARFLRQLDPGFNRQFAAQKPESVSNKPM